MHSGGPPGRPQRSYVQDAASGSLKPLTPEGTWGLAISSEPSRIAATSSSNSGLSIWSDSGERLHQIPGSSSDDRPVAFSADGRFLWLFRRGEVPGHVHQLDVHSGKRTLWQTLEPPDTAGGVTSIASRG